jgi:hypothetical protein
VNFSAVQNDPIHFLLKSDLIPSSVSTTLVKTTKFLRSLGWRYEVRLLNNETAFAGPELLPAARNRMHGYWPWTFPHMCAEACCNMLTWCWVRLLCVRKCFCCSSEKWHTKIEQRTNIKFLAKLKKTATETYQLLREVMENIPYHERVSLNGTEGF